MVEDQKRRIHLIVRNVLFLSWNDSDVKEAFVLPYSQDLKSIIFKDWIEFGKVNIYLSYLLTVIV